ncbi:hypothetical protein RB600_005082 [Gaeumannomyces tritici]
MKNRMKPLALAMSLLTLATAALAHGAGEGMRGRDMEMDMGHGHGHGHGEGAATPSHAAYPESYFSHPELQGVLYAHIAVMVVAWVFVLPVAVMFSIARSRHTLVVQLIFAAVNGAGLVLGTVYNDGTPDLYPGNAHHGLGWALTAALCAQVAVGALGRLLAGVLTRGKSGGGGDVHGLATPVSAAAMAAHHRQQQQQPAPFIKGAEMHSPYRLFGDSGDGAESLRSPTFSSSSSSTLHRHRHDDDAALKEGLLLRRGKDDGYSYDDDQDGDETGLDTAALGSSSAAGRIYRTAKRATAAAMSSSGARAWRVLVILAYDAVDRAILPLGFVALSTGVAAHGRLFEGPEILSGLAHWIKGGVFFWLGLVTLGRWAGAFADLGWAWNLRPEGGGGGGRGKQQRSWWCPSAEFVESGLIFFYGSTNIFLEHLGGDGSSSSKWSAQDLEHVAITVLFIGGGLCGMLVESAAVRDLLNTSVVEAAAAAGGDNDDDDDDNDDRHLKQPTPTHSSGVSLNPIPALVILLLGVMMSSHTQGSAVAGMVHKQWGTLLTGAALARALTYVLLYLRPPPSVLPSRPPTELLAAFGLSAGGIVFMASSGDTVAAMVNQELDAMFIYTVTMGLVALLMAWVVAVMALKGWAVRRERGRPAAGWCGV